MWLLLVVIFICVFVYYIYTDNDIKSDDTQIDFKKLEELEKMMDNKYHISLIKNDWAIKYPSAISDFIINNIINNKFGIQNRQYNYLPGIDYSVDILLSKLYIDDFLKIYNQGEAYFKYKQQEAERQYKIHQDNKFNSMKLILGRYVNGMDSLSDGHKYIYLRDYYPCSQFSNMPYYKAKDREEIWAVCGEAEDGSRLTTYDISSSRQRNAYWLSKKIIDIFGEDSKQLALVCYPSRTKSLYEGFKYFSEMFCKDSQIVNGFDYLKVNDAVPISQGGTGIRTVIYDNYKLYHKHIILFIPLLRADNDVVDIIKNIEKNSCNVVCVLAFAKDITY